MLVNRGRLRWWLRLAGRLAAFCLVISTCSIALSQEKPPSGEFAGVEAPTSPEGSSVDQAMMSSPENTSLEALAEPPTEETAAEPDETLTTGEMLGEPATLPEIGPSDPGNLQLPSPLTALPAGQPFAGDWLNARESGWRMLVGLLLVLALICIMVFALKRIVGGAPVFLDQRLGRVIGRIPLGPKAILYLVRVGGKILVVGTTPTAISLVAEITDPEIVNQMEGTRAAESARIKTPFGGRMGRFFSKSSQAERSVDEEVRFEEYLRDIRGQMEKLSALVGGREDEEEL
jgi:flagellar biogenesis protein FliO